MTWKSALYSEFRRNRRRIQATGTYDRCCDHPRRHRWLRQMVRLSLTHGSRPAGQQSKLGSSDTCITTADPYSHDVSAWLCCLADARFRVRALVRSPSKVQAWTDPEWCTIDASGSSLKSRLDLVQGNAKDPRAVTECLQGASIVVSTVGQRLH